MTVVGRDQELAALASFLDPHDGGPSVLVLEGEAGMGKTTLWRAAAELAAERGYRGLACTAAELESGLSYTGLRDLLGDAFAEVCDALLPPQRRALGVVLLQEESPGPPPEAGAIALSALNAVRLVARDRPVAVLVDDVQWLDAPSARALGYGIRRLRGDDVVAILARRPAAGDELGLDDLAPDAVRRLTLGPLSVGALGRVVHTTLGIAYSRPTLHRIREVSGGNPFFALELARALGRVETPLRPDDPLPVPGNVRDLVRGRLATLPPQTFDALAFAATLSRPTASGLARVLGDGDGRLEPAVAAGIVELDGDAIRFTHPILAAAVYELAAPRRQSVHARLADVLPEGEERVRHLALSTDAPDPGVARTLEQAAAAAFSRGSPREAAELAGHAHRLTPPEDDAATARAILEVEYRFEAGDTHVASALLGRLLAGVPGGPPRARLLARKARVEHFGGDIGRSVALLEEALAEAGDDARLRGEIEEGLAWGMLLLRRSLPDAAAHARSAVALSERHGDATARGEALAACALVEFALGLPWQETMERARSLEAAFEGLRVLRRPSFALGYCLSCSDEHDRAREVFLELLALAEAAGDESSVPSILNHLTLVECLAGRPAAARRHADEGFTRALESGQRPTQVSIRAKQAMLAARYGSLDDADAAAREALGRLGSRMSIDPPDPRRAMAGGGETAIWTLGFVALARGEAEEAVRRLVPMCDALLAAGIQEPGEVRALPDAIEALVAAGRPADADPWVETLESWGRRLGRASTRAAAARCRGLLLADGGDAAAALASLAEAVALADGAGMPFEHGRALLALGATERRARRRKAARETLARAVETFERLGAETWASRARDELSRIGGRAPSPGGLTSTEQRVAGLVAEGKTNKEVAAALVISVHTVESALTSVYRKLDVRSRTELARKLTTQS